MTSRHSEGGDTYTARPPQSSRTPVVIALVIAVLALVISLAAVVISAIGLSRSDEAVELASKVLPTITTPPTGQPTTTPTSTDPGDPGDPGPTGKPNEVVPTTQFTIAYEGAHLRFRSHSCQYTNQWFVDLDEPRVVGEEEKNAELGYSGCNPGSLHTKHSFAEVSGPTATPKDCLEGIRTDPGRSPIAPTRGMTLCIVTDENAAAANGISQKLVFVTIDSVSVDNNLGVLNVTLKAWDVPQ